MSPKNFNKKNRPEVNCKPTIEEAFYNLSSMSSGRVFLNEIAKQHNAAAKKSNNELNADINNQRGATKTTFSP